MVREIQLGRHVALQTAVGALSVARRSFLFGGNAPLVFRDCASDSGTTASQSLAAGGFAATKMSAILENASAPSAVGFSTILCLERRPSETRHGAASS